ncbi:hypothetical protein WUBG_00850 [Wuchereria bancrofti]|uniref:Uncharacterized protein n=1 Tax=Wuchereria bancrofti TaxID=6293 RepID=J9BL73_WUCBA|nr:hypothetical protein WUBG_00850 [Wuchereria bancrofti]
MSTPPTCNSKMTPEKYQEKSFTSIIYIERNEKHFHHALLKARDIPIISTASSLSIHSPHDYPENPLALPYRQTTTLPLPNREPFVFISIIPMSSISLPPTLSALFAFSCGLTISRDLSSALQGS